MSVVTANTNALSSYLFSGLNFAFTNIIYYASIHIIHSLYFRQNFKMIKISLINCMPPLIFAATSARQTDAQQLYLYVALYFRRNSLETYFTHNTSKDINFTLCSLVVVSALKSSSRKTVRVSFSAASSLRLIISKTIGMQTKFCSDPSLQKNSEAIHTSCREGFLFLYTSF